MSVFVTGVNGYIAQHLVLQLLAKNYKVIGSVRSEEKGKKLAENILNPNFSFVVVPDLTTPGAFDEVLEQNPEIEGFFHTASPVVMTAEDFENDVIVPAVEGTKNVLDSVHRCGVNVKRFVFTSSFAAIGDPSFTKNDVITEDTWTKVARECATSGAAYKISKTYAEKAVWEFFAAKTPTFDFNVINPVFVFGPQAFDVEVKETLNFSAEIINKLLKLDATDEVPEFIGSAIDVRDVARSHIIAYETEEYSKNRFITSETYFSYQDCIDVINEHYPQLNLPKGVPGSGPQKLAEVPKVDNKKSRGLLGPFMGLEQSIIDTVDQIVKNKASSR